MPFARTIVKDA